MFADLLHALPRERVLSCVFDALQQLCCDGGSGAEAVCDTAAITCALCSSLLLFDPRPLIPTAPFLRHASPLLCPKAACSRSCTLCCSSCQLSGCCICKCTSASWQTASAANTGQPAPRSPATLCRTRCLLLRRDCSDDFPNFRRQPHLQRERSADPLLFIVHYVQQVAPSCKLPLKLCGNIHLLRQRWWKSTFIPALLTPPPHGGSRSPPGPQFPDVLQRSRGAPPQPFCALITAPFAKKCCVGGHMQHTAAAAETVCISDSRN